MSKVSSKDFISLGKAVHSWILLNSSRETYIEGDENQDSIHHFNCGWNNCRAELIESLFFQLNDLSEDDDSEEESFAECLGSRTPSPYGDGGKY